MHVALYARVSTRDKDQNPGTQLLPLRDFAAANGWATVQEYVDWASAGDVKNRRAWRQLLDAAGKRQVDLIVVWRMDRAFRSVLDAAQTLERLRTWGVGLRSYQEPWLDTTSPFGEALYYITVAYAQLERNLIAERVKAGMDRAKREGKRVGRPKSTDDAARARRIAKALAAVRAGKLSWRQAARQADVAVSTLQQAAQQSPP